MLSRAARVASAFIILVAWCQCAHACGDAGCMSVRRTLKCSGNSIYDVAFVLDNSKSMDSGIAASKSEFEDKCPVDLDKPNCLRKDTMRFVLRQVLLALFQDFQQPCLEFLETSGNKVEDIGACVRKGFTQPRLHFVWWGGLRDKMSSYTIVLTESFAGPYGEQTPWNKLFTSRFYANEFGNKYEINPDMWEYTRAGSPKMIASRVDEFFKEILMADDTANIFQDPEGILDSATNTSYPQPYGSTKLSAGLDKTAEILKAVYNRDYKQGGGNLETFPVFVMTDGQIDESEKDYRGYPINPSKTTSSIKNAVESTDENNKTRFFGLSLSSDPALLNIQKKLYEDLGYTTHGIVNGERINYEFSNNETSVNVVRSMLADIRAPCEYCYTYEDVTKCQAADKRPLSKADFVGNNGVYTPREVRVTDRTAFVVSRRTESVDAVKIIGKLVSIPVNTTLCWNIYSDDNGKTNKYGSYRFTTHKKDTFACECCSGLPSPCLCEYLSGTKYQPTSKENVFGVIQKNVPNFGLWDPLAREIEYANSQSVTPIFPLIPMEKVGKIGGDIVDDTREKIDKGNQVVDENNETEGKTGGEYSGGNLNMPLLGPTIIVFVITCCR